MRMAAGHAVCRNSHAPSKAGAAQKEGIMPRTLPVIVSTRDYEFSHGHRPRGFGAWAFCPTHVARRPDYLDHALWVYGQTYADAKKVAAHAFAGCIEIVVLP